MFKVIIADDEEPARKMLITAADWQALNMEIIAEAVSGQDALSIMEEQLPDILFTDIKMPYMDGMELCHIVTRKYPHIKIVITTAFKDFDYAHQCISLGVSHFLLKPINRSDLVSTLLKLREQIESEKQQWFEFDHLKKILKKNYSFLRERFLLEFCENSTRSASTEQQIAYYFPEGIPSYIQVTLLKSHASHAGDLTEEERLLQDMKNLEFIKKYLEGQPVYAQPAHCYLPERYPCAEYRLDFLSCAAGRYQILYQGRASRFRPETAPLPLSDTGRQPALSGTCPHFIHDTVVLRRQCGE